MNNLLTNTEKEELKKFLGEEGIRFFRHLKGLKGTVIPVHFREGMQIRNWLRENAAFAKDQTPIDLDDCYESILEDIIAS